MLGKKSEITKDERSVILQIVAAVKQINWCSSNAFSAARKAAARVSDALCQSFGDAAKEHRVPLSTYIRNLIAESSKKEIGAWTAFLQYAVSSKKPGYAELREAAHFLTDDPRNCGFLIQLLTRKDHPSFESAVLFFQDEPEKGLAIGLKTLPANQSHDPKAIVAKIKALLRVNNKILSGKNLAETWITQGLPKLDFVTFMKLPPALRQGILSDRFSATSILDSSTIDHLKSNIDACRQSPLFAFFFLKKKSNALKKAIASQDWSHPGLIALLTVFLTEEVKQAVLDACKQNGYGNLNFEEIQAIPDKRLKNAFLFATSTAKTRLSFLHKLTLNEQIDVLEDIPVYYWPETFAAISGTGRFESIFADLNSSGNLQDFLRRYLIGSSSYAGSGRLSERMHLLFLEEEQENNRKKADRIALTGAAAFGFFDLIHEAIRDNPSRYRSIFEEKAHPIIKTIISSASTIERLAELIHVYGETFVGAWLAIAPLDALKRLGQLVQSQEASVLGSCKKDVLKTMMKTCPKRIKTILQKRPDTELYRFVFENAPSRSVKSIENLIDLKEMDGSYFWEDLLRQTTEKDIPPSLLKLIGSGKSAVLKKAFELCPDIFYKQAVKRIPLRQVLLTAFRNPKIGHCIERNYPRSRLLKEISWVRETFRAKPTVSTAYETALALSLPDASYLLYLATLRWKERKSRQPGHAFDDLYWTYPLPKKAGGTRLITAPDPQLKRLQRRVLRNGFENIAVHPAAHGFLKEHSIVTNASHHTRQKLVINLDIAGFFPNTRYRNIIQACKRLNKGRLSTGAVMLIADICSYNGGLPTGAPTSPHIGNIVLESVDKAIDKVALRKGINYTRYADDLTFSGDDDVKSIIPFVRKVLLSGGYKLDPKKTNLFRRGRRQMVTGLVVNERPNLPRHIRKKIRAAAHWMENGKTPRWHDKPVAEEKIMGLIAHLNAASPKEAAKYKEQAKSHRVKGKRKG